MTTRKDVEGPSTRVCRTKKCGQACSGRRHYCDTCRKRKNYREARSALSQSVKVCESCNTERDREEFIVSIDKNVAGHVCARYGPDCDDCRMAKEWEEGIEVPDIDGHPPYEAAKRLLAYEYKILPSRWMNRTTPLARLHYLTMCKLGNLRPEGLDQRIQEQRDVIRRHGPL